MKSEKRPAKSKRKRMHLSNKERIFFVKRLSFLAKAGIPVLESLQMMLAETKSAHQKKILEDLIFGVSRGSSLSQSMETHKKAFGDFSIHIVRFGESAGLLSGNLEYLAQELQKREGLRKKIIGAFIYPIVVALATLGITVFLLTYLFPKITPVFTSLHVALPFSTRTVIFVSELLKHRSLLMLALLCVFCASFILAKRKSVAFRMHLDRNILRLPLVGGAIRSYNLANSARTLGLLLKSGIDFSDALPMTEQASGNLAYRKEFAALAGKIRAGERMSAHFSGNPSLFPEIVGQIVSVGEKSGSLSSSLLYISELYETEVDEFTKNIGNVIEPAMMILMGILVGFIAISIITPIYSITQNLHA
jgi:type II secretory pathway component PulF